jgi:hypothetical protein
MLNKYIKYIVLVFTCCMGIVFTARCQQADTTYNATDTVAVDSAGGDVTSDTSYAEADTASAAALNKFLLKNDSLATYPRQIPDKEVKKITSDDDFWYAGKPIPKKKPVKQSSTNWGPVVKVIFWVFIGACFIAILLLLLVNSKTWVFARKAKQIRGEDTAEVTDDAEGNIFEMDFEARIAKALEAQDYRLATRLLFLRLLRSMAERNIISYSIDKTNMDYLFELGQSKYFKEFSVVTRNYEYVWYGNFAIQQSQFMYVQQRLNELNSKIIN